MRNLVVLLYNGNRRIKVCLLLLSIAFLKRYLATTNLNKRHARLALFILLWLYNTKELFFQMLRNTENDEIWH